jgi:hypothetical protein
MSPDPINRTQFLESLHDSSTGLESRGARRDNRPPLTDNNRSSIPNQAANLVVRRSRLQVGAGETRVAQNVGALSRHCLCRSRKAKAFWETQ